MAGPCNAAPGKKGRQKKQRRNLQPTTTDGSAVVYALKRRLGSTHQQSRCSEMQLWAWAKSVCTGSKFFEALHVA